MKIITELTEKIKLELTEKGKNFSADEVNSFYEWMKVEYKNYMMLSMDNALNTLNKVKTIYGHYIPMVEVLENNIDEYGSLQSFYRASIDLTNTTLPIHGVMGSFIKELDWVDNPKPSGMDIEKVVARAYIQMPHTLGEASIEITHNDYYDNYDVRLWWFNCGTVMNEHNCKTIEAAKKTASEWWSNFVCGFLNCP